MSKKKKGEEGREDFLRCDAMKSSGELPKLQRNILPLSSSCHMPNDCSLNIHCYESLISYKFKTMRDSQIFVLFQRR
jgi:hypothetical protein